MLKNYILVALRNLRNNKVFSVINILGLTLGIACSLAIFMIVRYELSFDHFHPNYKRICRVVSEFRYPEGKEYQSGVPYPLPRALKNDFPQLAVTTILGDRNNQITIPDGTAGGGSRRFMEKEGIFYADSTFFEIFHFSWLLGDARQVMTQPHTVALTKSTAEKYFGDWQKAIGKTILMDNEELLTVKGILDNPPANTDFPLVAVISYATIAGSLPSDNWGAVSSQHQCYIMLPENESIEKLSSLIPAFTKKYRNQQNQTDFYNLQPLEDLHFNALYGNFGSRTVSRESLWVLSLIGVFLLLLGCINFTNLATAQAVRRSKEVGIRKVLGGGRSQLALQFLGETALLVLISSLLAVMLVTALSPLFSGMLNGAHALHPLQSAEAMIILAIIGLTITLLAGFYPAIIISGFKPIEAFKNKINKAGSNLSGGVTLRRILVVFQFTIAQILIVGVLVAMHQMNFFRNTPLGFDKDAIITVSLPTDSVSMSKWESYRQQLLRQSGIEQVSLCFAPPAGKGTNYNSFRFNQDIKDENFEMNIKAADEAYPATFHLSLAAGRFYQPSDTIREIVVNETLLKKEGIMDPQSALGKYIYLGDSRATIVGVVRDFHDHSLRDPIDAVGLTTSRKRYRIASIRLSTTQLPAAIKGVEQTFTHFFPDYVFEHQFLDETISHFYADEERLSHTFKFFAAISLIISCLGLYGLILFTTFQRMKEVGIRKVLGASVANISLLFIREFCWLIGIAFVIACPIAWYLMTKWLENFTYRIHITSWIFLATGMTALLVGMLTISFQTIRTALANPVKSLKAE
jgi:putative ABC transport system permease protein